MGGLGLVGLGRAFGFPLTLIKELFMAVGVWGLGLAYFFSRTWCTEEIRRGRLQNLGVFSNGSGGSRNL